MSLFSFKARSQGKNLLQPIPGFDQAKLDTIAKYVTGFPNNTQLSIAIIKAGKVQYLGVIRQSDEIQSVQNQQAIFEIGSVTKVFTASLLAELVQQEVVSLETPIQSLLPFPLKQAEKDGKVITLQSLANHTAGLPRLPDNLMPLIAASPDDPYKDYTEKELETYLQNQMTLTTTPGASYAYSNLGAGLLGYILSKKTGKSYSALLKENIFKPLKMSHSSVNEPIKPERLVKGLDPQGEPTSNWHLAALAGAGAILSTTEDLSKFALANFKNNPTFTLQRKETYKINDNMAIGLGWHIIKTKDGQQWHWHNGGTGGYTSSMALNINQQTAVLILSNVSAFHPKMDRIDQLCFKLMNML